MCMNTGIIKAALLGILVESNAAQYTSSAMNSVLTML